MRLKMHFVTQGPLCKFLEILGVILYIYEKIGVKMLFGKSHGIF